MIDVRGVRFAYDGRPAVVDASFAVDAGEILAVMGANGAGKTTLLKLLAGLRQPDAGRIDRPPDAPVGFAPEDPKAGLFAPTVYEEVAFFPRNRGLDVDDRTDAAMAAMAVGHLADRSPVSLSVGEQRRVSIAAVLAGDPAVIALDEPTAGLDRAGERRLADRLADLEAAVVVSTHESDFAHAIADRVLVLESGRVRRIGDAGAVLGDAAFLREVGLRPPGAVEWAAARGFDRPPASVEEAVAMARGSEP